MSGNEVLGAIVTVVLAIIAVAVIAVLVSKNATTSTVLSAGSSAFSGGLATAISPITGEGTLGFAGGAAYY